MKKINKHTTSVPKNQCLGKKKYFKKISLFLIQYLMINCKILNIFVFIKIILVKSYEE